MKIKFSIKEKLYAMCNFEVECESREDLEWALDEIGENCSAEEFYSRLVEEFGEENVSAEGVNSVDNIENEDEIEFWDWEDD